MGFNSGVKELIAIHTLNFLQGKNVAFDIFLKHGLLY